MDITNIESPSDFTMVDGADLEDAAQQCVAMMAYNQAQMNVTAEAYMKHLIAKEAYSHYRQIASVLQSLLRAGR